MSNGDAAAQNETVVVSLAAHRAPERVVFSKDDLQRILSVYGRKVAQGEWRDYALEFGRQAAVFSVFRRAAEVPLFRIEKRPALANRQGAYAVVSSNGQVLKRGADLTRVLMVLEKPARVIG